MNKVARGSLYFFAAIFTVIGAAALLTPDIVAAGLYLSPVTIAGTAEIRGLYGGGFIGFAAVLFCGLRCRELGPGLLLAMAIIMGGVVTGRLVSLVIDHETAATIPAAIAELLLVLACWVATRNKSPAP